MALAHLFSPPAPPEILLPAQNHFGPGRSTVSPVSGPVTHTLPCRLRLIGQAAPFLGAFPDARPAPWALCDPLPSCPVWAFRTAVNSDRQRQSGRQWGWQPSWAQDGRRLSFEGRISAFSHWPSGPVPVLETANIQILLK